MEDRIPTPGQEGRVKITPESGNPFYAKLEMADNPMQEGTALNKANLLNDVACDALGIPRTSVVNDALLGLAIGAGKYGYKITLLTPGGRPLGYHTIQGVTRPNGTPAVTDANGQVLAVSASTTPAITIGSDFVDLSTYTGTLTSTGVITDVTITMPRNTTASASVSTSTTYYFGPDVNTIRYSLVGGGGGGGGSSAGVYVSEGWYYNYANGGGGGSGYLVDNQTFTNNVNLAVNIVIGAGGAGGVHGTLNSQAGNYGGNAGTGGTGGSSTISQGSTVLATVNGGNGGTGANTDMSSAIGGTGGTGQVNGSAGGASKKQAYAPSQGIGGVLASIYGGYGNGGNSGYCTVDTGSGEAITSTNGSTGAGGACWLSWTF